MTCVYTVWYLCMYIYIYVLHVCICNSTSRCSGLPTESCEPSRNPPDCRVAATVPEALAGGAGSRHVWGDMLRSMNWWWKNGELVDWLDMIHLSQDGIQYTYVYIFLSRPKRNLRLLHCSCSCRLLKVNLHNTIDARSTMSSKRRCRASLKMTRLTRWWFQSSSVLALNFTPRLGETFQFAASTFFFTRNHQLDEDAMPDGGCFPACTAEAQTEPKASKTLRIWGQT